MARVIVTARPGFEEVVNWYMATGQIWNGGQVPTVDDPLFLSIVEELKIPEGKVEETWETRVPTSLTVIQAGSIGLNVEGLPCNTDCNDFRLFDSDGIEILDADGNSFTNPIAQSNAQIGVPQEGQTTASNASVNSDYDLGKLTTTVIYNEVDTDGKDEYRFRLLDDRGEVLLSSSKRYDTQEEANATLEKAASLLIDSPGYAKIKKAADDRWYFNVTDTDGKVIARKIEYFDTEQECEDEVERLRTILINN